MAEPRPRLVLATANPGKVAELRDLLGDRFTVEPRPADLADTVEDGETLEANALKKATEVAHHSGTAALADDTGLFVHALGGAPGVHTARYAGEWGDAEDNIAKLLSELDGRPPGERRAEFRTVIALVRPGRADQIALGSVAGTITGAPRGEGGFGYDPVFEPDGGGGRTFAEMTSEDKNRFSHRARALRAMLERL